MWEDIPFVLFLSVTSFTPTFSSPYLPLAKKPEMALAAQEVGQARAGAGQPRLGGLRAFRVKAGYGCQPGVHGPERQARHSAWESGQTGAEWEQRQERAGTDSSGKENGIHCQRLICLASGPEVCGWIGLLEAWVTGDKQPPFPTVPVAKSS